LVEFCKATVEKVEEALTCQLYPAMPLGSLTADHEMVNGDVRFAAAAGEMSEGAGGAAAAAKVEAAKMTATTNSSMTTGRIFIRHLRAFVRGRRIIGKD
jgi:hypothetical protein